MNIIRERAYQLKEGILRNRGEALLPLMLASYIFESLVINAERPDEQDENVSICCLCAGCTKSFDRHKIFV